MFHCLVIKVLCLSTACLLYHIPFPLSSTFFKFFLTFPKFGILWDVRLIDILFTLSCIQTFVNNFFIFLKSFQKNNGEGGIWTLAPLLTTYSLSRGAPSASLGTSPNCPRFAKCFRIGISLWYLFAFPNLSQFEKPCVLYLIHFILSSTFFKFFKLFICT